MRPDSRILAAGNEAGKLYFVRVSDDLTQSEKKDKGLLTSWMDRESQREKILSDKMREIQLKLRTEPQTDEVHEERESAVEKRLQAELEKLNTAAEKEFMELKNKEKSRRRKEYFGGNLWFQRLLFLVPECHILF